MEPYNMNNRMKMVNTKNLQGYLTSWLVSVIDTKSFETKKEFWYSIEGHDIQIKTVTKYVIIEEGIRAINNPLIGRTEFAFMVEELVKHPVEPLGFYRGATEWYTRNPPRFK